jgi:GYF domain 2
MKNDWYYMSNGQKHGPVSSRQLKGLADEGRLLPEDLIWTPGFSEWKPAGFLKGLFPQGLRISLGRLGALGKNGSGVLYSPAGRGSGASCTIDRQDHSSSSGTSAP